MLAQVLDWIAAPRDGFVLAKHELVAAKMLWPELSISQCTPQHELGSDRLPQGRLEVWHPDESKHAWDALSNWFHKQFDVLEIDDYLRRLHGVVRRPG